MLKNIHGGSVAGQAIEPSTSEMTKIKKIKVTITDEELAQLRATTDDIGAIRRALTGNCIHPTDKWIDLGDSEHVLWACTLCGKRMKYADK